MGMINIEVNTDNKIMDVKVDGKAVVNVREVYAYQSFDSKGAPEGFSMSITTVESSEDIRKVTTYVASGSAEAIKAEESGSVVDRSIPGMVGIRGETDSEKELKEYLTNVFKKGR